MDNNQLLTEIQNRLRALEQLLTGVVRTGVVTSVDENHHRVKCRLPGADDKVTGWLQVLTSRARHEGAAEYDLPVVGEQGPCLFLPPGPEVGFYLGSIFSHADQPPAPDRHKWRKQFKGGAYIEFDEDAEKAVLHMPVGWTLFLGGETDAKPVARVGDMVEVSYGSSAGQHPIAEGSSRVKAVD
jgi:phage baseplate assembly protein V